MGTDSGHITKVDELIINMDAANSRSYTSGSTSCNCLVSTVSGTLENGTSFTPEYKGGWIFGGSDDYINLGNRTKINPELNSFTTNIFFKIDSNSTSSNIIASKGNGVTGDIGWLIYYSNTNDILTVRCNGNNTPSQRAAQYIPINKGQVYMVTMVINRADNTIKGYLNGSNVGWINGNYIETFSGNSISGFGSITNSDDFLVGERPQLNLPMYGTIYLFQTYNFALSEAQVYRNFRFFGGRYDLSVPPPPPSFFNDYSFDFDGTDDYVQLGSSFATSGTDWSISLWWKSTATGGNRYMLGGGGTLIGGNWGNIVYSVSWPDSVLWNMNYSMSWNDGNWHQAVFTYNYTSGDWKLYIDGSNVISQVASTGQDIRPTNIFGAGRASSYFFPGNLDEISYFSTELSASAVADMYNSGKPTDISAMSGLQGHWRMGDNGAFKYPQWLLPSNENKDKASNYSMSFDGTNDYISVGDIFDQDGSTAFSISAWVKLDDVTYFQMIVAKMPDASPWNGYSFYTSGTNIKFAISENAGSSNLFVWEKTSVVSAGVWYHMVATYDGSLDVSGMNVYLDGAVLTPTTASNGSTPFDSSSPGNNLQIGARGGVGLPLAGLIDEVNFWNIELTPSNVTSIYNFGIPSDVSGLEISGLAGYWKMGTNGTFKSTQWLLPNNENKDKFSNYSMSFDGTNDYISIPTSANNILPGATKMTVSLWWKREVYDSNTRNMVGYYNAGPFRVRQWQHMLVFEVSDNSNWVGWEGATLQTNTASPLAVSGIWHNIVCTWEAATNEMRAYIDGVECDASPSTTTISALYSGVPGTDPNLNIMKNASQGGYGKGEVSDVSIWNKVLTSGERTSLYNSGEPTDLSSESGLVGYWKMGEDATFSTNWTVPDQIGINDGTSNNMDINDRVGNAPGSSGNTVSYNMDIYDRVGEAPGSTNNALSYNMVLSGRTTNVPT